MLQPLTQVECVCTPLHPSVAPGLKLDSNSEVCQHRWPPTTSFHLQVVVLEQWSVRNASACLEHSDSSHQCKTGFWRFQWYQKRVQLAAAAVAWFFVCFTCQRKMFMTLRLQLFVASLFSSVVVAGERVKRGGVFVVIRCLMFCRRPNTANGCADALTCCDVLLVPLSVWCSSVHRTHAEPWRDVTLACLLLVFFQAFWSVVGAPLCLRGAV